MTKVDTKKRPEAWESSTLGGISTNIAYGYTESASQVKVGPKFLRITDIQNDFINWNSVPYCPITTKNFEKYKLEIGDIVIARTGNSTGATSTIKDKIEAVFASYLIRYKINPNIANYNYIDFLLRSRIWESFVESIKGGSAQGGANAKNFAEFPILLPPLKEQKSIADVLSSLDDKIELLREQNKTMEAIAQALFKRWFVDFEFPDEEGKPYKSTRGEMVESELGKIPEGWSVLSFTDVADYINGKSFSEKDFSYNKKGVSIIKIAELKNGINNLTMYTQNEYEDKYIIKPGDILFSWSGSPETSIDIFLWDKKNAYLNQHIFNVVSKNQISKSWLYFLLKYNKPLFIEIAKQKQTTGLGHLTQNDLKRRKLAFPSNMVFSRFTIISDLYLNKILNNLQEIHTLIDLRDSLLPRLMKGEIRVRYENL